MCKTREKWLIASIHSHMQLWIYSLRTVIMFIFVLLMNYMLVRSYKYVVEQNQYDVHIIEMVFLYAYEGFNMIMTSIAFLVMMSEIPKSTAYQSYMLVRMSKRKWAISLILFCVAVVVLFSLLMVGGSMAFSWTFASIGNTWSDIERLAVDPNYAFDPQLVPEFIRVISPFKASILALAVPFLFWLTMALVIMLFSLCGKPNVGMVVCVSLLLLNITILFEYYPNLRLPGHFSTLASISAQYPEQELECVRLVLIGYITIIMLIISLIMWRSMNMNFQFAEKE